MYPRGNLPVGAVYNTTEWSERAYNLAVELSYPGIDRDTLPDSEYLNTRLPIALQQICLGGYRLADLLTNIWGYDTKKEAEFLQ
jgi:hypothetical protein